MISHTICEIWNPAFCMCRAKLQTRVWASNSFFLWFGQTFKYKCGLRMRFLDGLCKTSNTSVSLKYTFWVVCAKILSQEAWNRHVLCLKHLQMVSNAFPNLKVVLSKVTRFFPSIVLPCIASLSINIVPFYPNIYILEV